VPMVRTMLDQPGFDSACASCRRQLTKTETPLAIKRLPRTETRSLTRSLPRGFRLAALGGISSAPEVSVTRCGLLD
jgi:hypothetical protein